MRSVFRSILVLAAVALAAACSSEKVQVAPPDELYRQATQDFVDGNYSISIQTYKYLLDHYPLDDRAEDVELRIAEAQFADGAYPEAIASYTDFQRMHPTSPRLAEVEYQIGMAYVGQMDTIDRDLNAAANAHARFESVIVRFPKSEYAKRAKEQLKAVREHLASRELYVAQFYIHQGNHAAARIRVGNMLVTYPETNAATDAIALIASDAHSTLEVGVAYNSVSGADPSTPEGLRAALGRHEIITGRASYFVRGITPIAKGINRVRGRVRIQPTAPR